MSFNSSFVQLKLRYKLLLLGSVVFILLLLAFFLFFQIEKSRLWHEQAAFLQNELALKIAQGKDQVLLNAIALSSDKQLINILTKSNHSEAYSLLKNIYEQYKLNYSSDLLQIKIHPTYEKGFKRPWQIDSKIYQLLLDKESPNVIYETTGYIKSLSAERVIKLGKPDSVVEIDQIGIALRGFVPILGEDAKVLGAIEFSQPLTDFLTFDSISSSETWIMLNEYSSDISFAASNITNWQDNYLLNSSNANESLKKLANNINWQKLQQKGWFDIGNYLVTKVTLTDWLDNDVGMFLSWKDKTSLMKILIEKINIFLVVTLSSLVFISIMIWLVLSFQRRNIVRRLNDWTKTIRVINNEGDLGERIELKSKRSALDPLAEQINQLLQIVQRLVEKADKALISICKGHKPTSVSKGFVGDIEQMTLAIDILAEKLLHEDSTKFSAASKEGKHGKNNKATEQNPERGSNQTSVESKDYDQKQEPTEIAEQFKNHNEEPTPSIEVSKLTEIESTQEDEKTLEFKNISESADELESNSQKIVLEPLNYSDLAYSKKGQTDTSEHNVSKETNTSESLEADHEETNSIEKVESQQKDFEAETEESEPLPLDSKLSEKETIIEPEKNNPHNLNESDAYDELEKIGKAIEELNSLDNTKSKDEIKTAKDSSEPIILGAYMENNSIEEVGNSVSNNSESNETSQTNAKAEPDDLSNSSSDEQKVDDELVQENTEKATALDSQSFTEVNNGNNVDIELEQDTYNKNNNEILEEKQINFGPNKEIITSEPETELSELSESNSQESASEAFNNDAKTTWVPSWLRKKNKSNNETSHKTQNLSESLELELEPEKLDDLEYELNQDLIDSNSQNSLADAITDSDEENQNIDLSKFGNDNFEDNQLENLPDSNNDAKKSSLTKKNNSEKEKNLLDLEDGYDLGTNINLPENAQPQSSHTNPDDSNLMRLDELEKSGNLEDKSHKINPNEINNLDLEIEVESTEEAKTTEQDKSESDK